MKVKHSQALSLIALYLQCGLVPMLHGSPGIGKSDLIRQIAKKFNLLLIDLRLSQCDPTDLLGFPTRLASGRSGYMPMETFPLAGDNLPVDKTTGKVYDGWLLFFDELPSASPAVQAASYKIILDRMVGQALLHKNVAMAAAGNLETDNAIVNPMSTALQSRLAHIELELDHKEWIDWATTYSIDHRITDYIGDRSDNLYTFKPDHTDKTYACPRTWEFANRLLTKGKLDLDSDLALPALAGDISEGVAREFIAHCQIYKDLPKMGAIEAGPDKIPVPDEPSVLYALTGTISVNTTDKNIEPVLKYVSRLPKEFQVATLRATVRRNKPLMQHKAVQQWLEKEAIELF
jgi:hypothetical protein